jgi:ABC-type multidrug transport system fused ATPase/permease subunit
VKEETEYAQLYLRLVAAVPLDEHLPNRLASIAKKQVATVVSKARLDSYAALVLALLTIMTISVIGPMLSAILSTVVQIFTLHELRTWPVPWKTMLDHTTSLLKTLVLNLESFFAKELTTVLEHPIQFALHGSMIVSLLVCTLLPTLERNRIISTASSNNEDDDFEEDVATSNMESAEEWSRLGTSSASRLSMLSENGSVESALERWKASRIVPLLEVPNRLPLSSIFRLAGYSMLGLIFAVTPIVVSFYVVGKIPPMSFLPVPRWDSLVDLSFLQMFLFVLVYQALWKVVESTYHVSSVKKFLQDLVETKEEMQESNKRQVDVQVMASVSASAGLTVRDLWAAHTTKRAWAVRGASLQCKNGEVLAVLGDDGEGKTRLLTSLAETLMFPPKRSLTTNKVRGYIAVGGLEASKWDRRMLKRRLGVLLSDVRMTADSASLFSGWTMEEILEPVDPQRSQGQINPLQRKLTSGEKSSMLLALKVRIIIVFLSASHFSFPFNFSFVDSLQFLHKDNWFVLNIVIQITIKTFNNFHC